VNETGWKVGSEGLDGMGSTRRGWEGWRLRYLRPEAAGNSFGIPNGPDGPGVEDIGPNRANIGPWSGTKFGLSANGP